MKKLLFYGLIAGVIVGGLLLLRVGMFGSDHIFNSRVAGYLVMLLALAFVFVGVKRYRDETRGGVIGFWRAFGAGLLVAGVASLLYVFAWEAYYLATGGQWMEDYAAGAIEDLRASGLTGSELDARIEQTRQMAELYGNWWFRFPITLSEILPVGVLVALASAAVLRNRRRSQAKAA